MNKEMPVSVWHDWKIVEKIGEGSFGKVYKAEQIRDGKKYYSAIKVVTIPGNQSELDSIRAEVHDDQEVRDYFRALVDECTEEVMMMVRLHGDSNIVSVEDCKVVEYLDDIGWDIFIRMEYLTGFTEYYSENPLTEKDVIKLGIDICRALENCRQRNVIHRDIKPENIFVSETGEYKLGDFGIARQLERTMSALSKKGTFSYMAPEMYRGEQYDSRADIYSLGIVLYKLRNHNRLPFLNLNKQLITYRDKENALTRRMSGENPSVPIDASEGLAKVILKACAYNVEERYASAEEMRADLEALIEEKKTEILPMKEKTEPHEEEYEELPKETGSERAEKLSKYDKKRKRMNIFLLGLAGAAVIVILFFGLKMTLTGNTNGISYDKQELTKELERIQKRANVISEQLNGYNWVEDENKRIQYFDTSWQLMKVLVYPDASRENCYEEYFYWYGKCFFAYIWTNDSIDYYYFDKNGELIRWIDSNDACHDYDLKNPEYLERGQRYWKNSVDEMERVQNGISY